VCILERQGAQRSRMPLTGQAEDQVGRFWSASSMSWSSCFNLGSISEPAFIVLECAGGLGIGLERRNRSAAANADFPSSRPESNSGIFGRVLPASNGCPSYQNIEQARRGVRGHFNVADIGVEHSSCASCSRVRRRRSLEPAQALDCNALSPPASDAARCPPPLPRDSGGGSACGGSSQFA